MVHSRRQNREGSYGPSSPRQRHDDGGSPSRNPSSSRERESARSALRHQSDDRSEVAQATDHTPTRAWGRRNFANQRCSHNEEEAIVVAFRRHTLLPLDDCLYALQPTIPHLRRSSLHRCFQRHDIARLPEDRWRQAAPVPGFKAYPIGYFHLDIAEVHTEEGRLYLLVTIDRTSKFAFVQLHERATRRIAADFLRALVAAVPYTIHTVLTDNGTQFTDPTGDGWTPKDIRAMRAEGVLLRCHSFEAACADLDIDHRLTKPLHPWTNGQVERMNRTIKDATVRALPLRRATTQLERHLADFIAAYNFGRRLKTLKGLTPYEFICKRWAAEPERFRSNPLHQMPGLKHLAVRDVGTNVRARAKLLAR